MIILVARNMDIQKLAVVGSCRLENNPLEFGSTDVNSEVAVSTQVCFQVLYRQGQGLAMFFQKGSWRGDDLEILTPGETQRKVKPSSA